LPDVPTIADTVPGYEASTWFGVGAPRGTPPEIIAKLNAAFTSAVNDPDMRRKFAENAISPAPTSPEELGQLLRSENEKWDKLIREKGITVKPED
jgi:tripartite-type tricarboxylate transporter receptor subunit TctC